ncbi:hypothetical protein KEJ14_03450 [Candidatus Bathyarchaeota archaeon]|nr:hypothetical protein [Candidatus Bathyarchaeota archaeon]
MNVPHELLKIFFGCKVFFLPNVIRNFVKACLEDKRPRTTGEDGLLIMQIMEMSYLSAKLGREVAYEEYIRNTKHMILSL